MKKVIALGLATVFSISSLHATDNGGANQQNWDTSGTFLRFETPFQSASPERVALFNTEDFRTKHRASHNGDVQFVVFGGQNSNQANAAAYYMPNGLETLTFNASIDANNEGTATNATYWGAAQQVTTGGITPARIGATGNTALAYVSAYTSPTVYTATPFTLSSTAGTSTGTNTLAVIPTNASTTGQAILNTATGAVGAVDNFVVGTGTANTYSTYDLTQLRGLINTDANIGNFVVDTNKNFGILRPWNFGVGYAPNVQIGAGISESAFVSVITPELKRSHWGIGATWKQLLSEKDTGFWLELSTALQRVTMNMSLNEVETLALSATATEDPTYGTTWAASWTNNGFDAGDTPAPTNITQAFAQTAWNYGKLDGAQSVTRLADIELKLGYQFICSDQVMSNIFLGIVIPTGNKAQSVYLAEPVVGNGFHFGLMFGATQEIQWSMSDETRWSMRSDTQFRYLFKNTQVRSFDTLSNGQWSRYMMVWPDYATEQANGELLTTENSLRAYTPGINVFTQEVNVTPRAQARTNQALVVEHGGFKGEFGWNMLIRQAEQVTLVNDWVDNLVAFVDASNNATSLFNQTRTIYNDAYQSTPVPGAAAGDSQSQYNAASISATDLNLDSAASSAAFTNTPYLAIGYAFNEERSSVFSIGASYEISATNGYINDWMLWGKFCFTF